MHLQVIFEKNKLSRHKKKKTETRITKKTMIAMLNLHQDMTSKIILEKLFQFFLCLKFNIRWFISIVKIFFYSISLKQILHTTNFHDSLTTLHPKARQGLEGRAKARSGGSAQRDQRNGAERRNPGKPLNKMGRASFRKYLLNKASAAKRRRKKLGDYKHLLLWTRCFSR